MPKYIKSCDLDCKKFFLSIAINVQNNGSSSVIDF